VGLVLGFAGVALVLQSAIALEPLPALAVDHVMPVGRQWAALINRRAR
jgi:hypothetical protein